MPTIKGQYIKDTDGNPVAVIMPIDEYEELINLKEDREALSLYRQLKEEPEEYLSLDDAIKQLEKERTKKK